MRLSNHRRLSITQRRKRQPQLCFSVTLEKQEVIVNSDQQAKLPRFYLATSTATKATGLYYNYYNYIMKKVLLGPAPLYKRHQETEVLWGPIIPIQLQRHMLSYRKPHQAAIGPPRKTGKAIASCGREPTPQSEFLCVHELSCRSVAFLEPVKPPQLWRVSKKQIKTGLIWIYFPSAAT